MVAPICLGEGIDPIRFAIRWTTPPSSSVITKGATPFGAEATRLCRATPRFEGADAPKRITPPAPAATSEVTDATSLSSTGTTTVCSARLCRLHVARTLAVEHASGVVVVVGGGVVVVAGAVVVVGGGVVVVAGAVVVVAGAVVVVAGAVVVVAGAVVVVAGAVVVVAGAVVVVAGAVVVVAGVPVVPVVVDKVAVDAHPDTNKATSVIAIPIATPVRE
jgi:hypothetical protein